MHITEAMLIDTDRVRLRPMRIEDAPEVHALWTEPAMLRSVWGDTEDVPEAQSVAVIERSIELFQSRGAGLWCAFDRKEDALIGFCGLWFFDAPVGPQLVFGVGAGYTSRGFAFEIVRAVLGYGFQELGLQRVLVEVPNRRTRRLLERLGLSPISVAIDGVESPYYAAERSAVAADSVSYRLSRMPQPLLRL